MPYYDQSFSQPIQAVDLYRGEQDSSFDPSMSQAPPMDYGSMGAFDGLSSYGGGMDMGGFQHYQPAPDPILTSMQYGINDSEQQPSFAPQIQGEGSWFKKLLSSAVLGMAGGAGAPDAATAFSAGYQTVMMQRQQEQMMMQQQAKMQREHEMFELTRATKNIEYLKAKQEYSQMPDELKLKQDEEERQLLKVYGDIGLQPDIVGPNTPEGYKEVMAQIKKKGPGFIPVTTDTGIHIFYPKPGFKVPAGIPYQIGSTQMITDGTEDPSWFSDMVQENGRTARSEYERQQMSILQEDSQKFTAGQNQLDRENRIATSGNRSQSISEWMMPGNLTDTERELISSYRSEISRLSNPITNPTVFADKVGTEAKINAQEKLIEDIITAANNRSRIPGGSSAGARTGTSAPTGGLPQPKTMEEALALPPGTQFIDPQGNIRIR